MLTQLVRPARRLLVDINVGAQIVLGGSLKESLGILGIFGMRSTCVATISVVELVL